MKRKRNRIGTSRKRRRRLEHEQAVPIASASVQPIFSLSSLGRILAVPAHAVEAKPKTSVFALSVLLIVSLATHGLTNTPNPFQTTAHLQYFSNNNGYLEFLNLANQSGPRILNDGQSLTLNVSQSYIILFVPYNPHMQFSQWIIQGHATLLNATVYMTNLTMYGDTILVAITNQPGMAMPEFSPGILVLPLAFATLFNLLFWWKISPRKKINLNATGTQLLC